MYHSVRSQLLIVGNLDAGAVLFVGTRTEDSPDVPGVGAVLKGNIAKAITVVGIDDAGFISVALRRRSTSRRAVACNVGAVILAFGRLPAEAVCFQVHVAGITGYVSPVDVLADCDGSRAGPVRSLGHDYGGDGSRGRNGRFGDTGARACRGEARGDLAACRTGCLGVGRHIRGCDRSAGRTSSDCGGDTTRDCDCAVKRTGVLDTMDYKGTAR